MSELDFSNLAIPIYMINIMKCKRAGNGSVDFPVQSQDSEIKMNGDVQGNNVIHMSFSEFLTSLKNRACTNEVCNPNSDTQQKLENSVVQHNTSSFKANVLQNVSSISIPETKDVSSEPSLLETKADSPPSRNTEYHSSQTLNHMNCSGKGFCVSVSNPSSNQMVQRITEFYIPRISNYHICCKNITDEYSDFPISKCLQQFQSRSTESFKTGQLQTVVNECQLWVDKYTPTSCSAFLNTCPGIRKLRQWLEKWKDKNSKGENSTNKLLNGTPEMRCTKKRLRNDSSDCSDDDFIIERSTNKRQKSHHHHHHPTSYDQVEKKTENSDMKLPIGYNEDQVDSSNSNSPSGTGKSSLIYALANDLDFKVFELNPSSRRSGKDITSQFQSALNSHHVAKDNLSTNFSTFEMITSSSSSVSSSNKNKSKQAQRSAANFFKPISKKTTTTTATTTSEEKVNTSKKDVDCLNLNCNSVVLFDEVDVLFESDRGFWSGLSNLLQLARRPVVLTASDPSIIHNIPVPVYVCHTTSASLDIVIPYIRAICLAEGYDLSIQTANSLIKSIKSSETTSIDQSTEYCDLRRLINELQWFAVSSSSSSVCKTHNHMKNDSSIMMEFLHDPLVWFQTICPSLSGLRGRSNSSFKPSVKSKLPVGNDLYELFTSEDEVNCETGNRNNSEPMPSNVENVGENTIGTSNEADIKDNKENSLLIDCTLKALKEMSDNLSFWDICQSSVNRAGLSSIVDSLSQIIEVKNTLEINDNTGNNNTSPVNIDSSTTTITTTTGVNSRPATNSGYVKGVINLPSEHFQPIIPFDIVNDEFFNVCWIQYILNESQDNLKNIENKLNITNPSCISNPLNGKIISRSLDSSQTVSLAKCISDLNRCGIGGNRHDQMKTTVCDYLPMLHILASGECSKQVVSTKRRFLHYFDRISLFLHPSTREFLAKFHFS
uniref:ATPase_AAA_core domain-containing protein n=1 Tax=Trichobilharzia regenti TaxID=157069 RepID=A0AA85KGS0_TRIRE|nr:unnamed protein product [Trichobilharzia regenti]